MVIPLTLIDCVAMVTARGRAARAAPRAREAQVGSEGSHQNGAAYQKAGQSAAAESDLPSSVALPYPSPTPHSAARLHPAVYRHRVV